MAEFFILRKYRRGGVGTAAMAGDFGPLSPAVGRLRVARRNTPAMVFWPRLVGSLACVRDLKTLQMGRGALARAGAAVCFSG